MLSLIIVILGIFYCFTRITSEIIRSRLIDTHIESCNELTETARKEYGADRDLINSYTFRYIKHEKILFDEAHDVFDSIPSLNGLRMATDWRIDSPDSYNMTTIRTIQLAKQGKIDTVFSFGPVFYGITTPEGKNLSFTDQQLIDLGRWAQSEFRKFHPSCTVMFAKQDTFGKLQFSWSPWVKSDKFIPV